MVLRACAILVLTGLSLCVVAWAETIVFGNGAAAFEAPAGFRALTQAEMERKFPNSTGGSRAVGNASLGTTIIYGASASPLTEADLEDMQRSFTGMFEEASPGLEWIRNEIVQMNWKAWVYMEFTSEAVDTDIHNIVLFTTHQGQVVMFNFNSRSAEFEEYEEALRKSIDSIVLLER